MKIGKVVGNVVSTTKYDLAQGYKLLIIELLYVKDKQYIVAADALGAGAGQLVLIAEGHNIQHTLGKHAPIDALIMGIVDQEPVLQS